MKEKLFLNSLLKEKIPCNKVLENNDFLAFHDIAPKAPIHILIIPKNILKIFKNLILSLWKK